MFSSLVMLSPLLSTKIDSLGVAFLGTDSLGQSCLGFSFFLMPLVRCSTRTGPRTNDPSGLRKAQKGPGESGMHDVKRPADMGMISQG